MSDPARGTASSGRGHLRAAVARAGFRRLLAARLVGQFGDGVFQASLAGTVLFNVEHQTRAADIAAGFAVVLLPYSIIAPFAGVLIDRWWRQRILQDANLVRAVAVLGVGAEIEAGVTGMPLYASALLVVSLNRFILSALSAALPKVVDRRELVTANSLSGTSGAITTSVGAGVSIVVAATSSGYATLAAAAALLYLGACLIARGFAVSELGPDEHERAARRTVLAVASGLAEGARHVRGHPPAWHALATIGVARFCYGLSTVGALLLYRNYFVADGFFRVGLAGIGQLVGAVALGGGVAALVTPAATRRLGFVRWCAALLTFAGCVQVGLGLPYSLPLMLPAGVGLGFAAQGVKISVDTVLQRAVADSYRGRVFSIYDTLFNVAFVGSAVLTALALPDSGHAPLLVVLLGAGYLLTAAGYVRATARLPRVPEPATA